VRRSPVEAFFSLRFEGKARTDGSGRSKIAGEKENATPSFFLAEKQKGCRKIKKRTNMKKFF
jgi:hypothetical protein